MTALYAGEALGAQTPQSQELAASAAPNFDTPAAQLRIGLDRALGEHAFLLGEAMRTGIRGGDDFEAAGVALEENTVELDAMIESVYGADAAARFGELWRNHIAYLVDYTRALADDDEEAQELAEMQLHDYVTDFSAFLAGANPNLPEDVLSGLLEEHVQQLSSVAAFDEGNYVEAYPAVRATYAHMFTIGDGLSKAIAKQFPRVFTGQSVAFSPAVDLRVTLDRLLGEHTYLSLIAMRAGVADADDREAAADALDDNTAALSEAIAAIYGEDAGSAFDAMWTSHTDAYLQYVAGVADDDEAAQADAIDGLEQYQDDFSQFLAEANPDLSAEALHGLLKDHTQHLVDQATAYADREYGAAYATGRVAYAHVGIIAGALAAAIAAQFPDRFPDTGLAPKNETPPVTWLGVGLCAAALSAGWLLRGRRAARDVLRK